VLDDGRLTDAQGRTVDFRNTIIIMTSNLGSQYIMEPGLTPAQIEERVMAALRESFRPELLNRIDEVVIFQPLGRAQIAQIAEIQLRDLRQRLAERDMTLELTPAARERLADIGFDPVYGARPLRRAIQQRIVHPLPCGCSPATSTTATRLWWTPRASSSPSTQHRQNSRRAASSADSMR